MNTNQASRIVGSFIRQRREALGLSQRALGALFAPPVTTQFISNVERGVTPLPPVHVSTLTKALRVSEQELMSLMEREYTQKLSKRIGQMVGEGAIMGNMADLMPATLLIEPMHFDFIRRVYEAYRAADGHNKQAFETSCENVLSVQAPTLRN